MSKNEVNGVLPPCPKPQRHVHEVLGSVEIAVVKVYRPDDKKAPQNEDGRRDHYNDEKKKDSYCGYEKPKKDPYYYYEEDEKDSDYDDHEDKMNPCYDKPKKAPHYDYEEDEEEMVVAKRPCPKKEAHNHRFAKVTGEAIPYGCKDHYHEVKFRTDFYEGHYHSFSGKTGGAIPVGDRHVHFLESHTTFNSGHSHDFRLATLIEDPIGD